MSMLSSTNSKLLFFIGCTLFASGFGLLVPTYFIRRDGNDASQLTLPGIILTIFGVLIIRYTYWQSKRNESVSNDPHDTNHVHEPAPAMDATTGMSDYNNHVYSKNENKVDLHDVESGLQQSLPTATYSDQNEDTEAKDMPTQKEHNSTSLQPSIFDKLNNSAA